MLINVCRCLYMFINVKNVINVTNVINVINVYTCSLWFKMIVYHGFIVPSKNRD